MASLDSKTLDQTSCLRRRCCGHHTSGTCVRRYHQRLLRDRRRSCYECYAEADICSQGIASDGGVSLPDSTNISIMCTVFGTSHSLTSARAFQCSLTSGDEFLQWSPMIFEISGFARPGFCATTACWWCWRYRIKAAKGSVRKEAKSNEWQ